MQICFYRSWGFKFILSKVSDVLFWNLLTYEWYKQKVANYLVFYYSFSQDAIHIMSIESVFKHNIEPDYNQMLFPMVPKIKFHFIISSFVPTPWPPPLAMTSATTVETVVVHPLVLLSVVDHYNRIDKVSSQKRVVGCLLGSQSKGRSLVSNML